ncbi:MAG: MotA/TolQ/ExbB proton channel family protein [Bacteroidota bacterium]|nr:MotA/TolQ/ExbB proton channel family protein [Bacteroidota bacterium]
MTTGMQGTTLVGILLGVLSVFGAFFLEGGTFGMVVLLPALMIVFGGTFAATIAGSSWEQERQIPRLIVIAIAPPRYDAQQLVEQIVRLAVVARRDGVLGLERHLPEVRHPYLKKLLQHCIDGMEPESLRQASETELDFLTARHQANINLFVRMGGYSPTMGIIGTVMALIATLASAGGDPAVLIRHIATAFIATMWGIFMANIVWLPIADKLRTLHHEEAQLWRMITEGVLAIQQGETPSIVRLRLLASFPLQQQIQMLSRMPRAGIPASAQ